MRWHLFSSGDALANATVAAILKHAAKALAARGRFVIVLSGGTTPRRVYERLRLVDRDWTDWHVLFGDERCLPPGNPERNDAMAHEAWLAHVPIPSSQIHRIPAELGPSVGSLAYRRLLEDFDRFDLTLLGLGEDGHTASLFPGQQLGVAPDAPAAVPVYDAPKPPPERVSMSAARLSRSRSVLLLTAGSAKTAALSRLAAGEAIPAAAIQPAHGIDVFADEAAAADIPNASM